jgi:hypothetical protein
MQYFYSEIGSPPPRRPGPLLPGELDPEIPYLFGRRATRFTGGHTRPDVSLSNVMIESKRYSIFDSAGRLQTGALMHPERGLIPRLRRQIGDRAIHGPANIRNQSVILDLRGQRFAWSEAVALSRRIASELSDELTRRLGRPTQFPVGNIQIVH